VTKFQHRTIDPRVERVEAAMGLIGSRWRPAIMFSLIMLGTQRFSELRRLIPGVSQRMLTKQLRDLERHGLVRRQFFESVPPRVEYSATDLGKGLHPIYKLVCDWAGNKWGDVTKARQRHDRTAKQRRPATQDDARTPLSEVRRSVSVNRSSGSNS
jgi:DNA-binding HxlR family transcriptional regulator